MALRGYFYQRLRYRTPYFGPKYYLDFTGKADYKFLDKDGLPKVNYHGDIIEFPVTTLNFFLGILDKGIWIKSHTQQLELFISRNLSDNGLLSHNFDERNWGNNAMWYSSLAQSMLFSLLCRLNHNGIHLSNCSLQKALLAMLDRNVYREGIFLEYPAVDSQPQNGQMFGCFAMLDAREQGLITKEEMKQSIGKTFELCRDQITFWGWTKYNGYRLASPFYHLLHIDMYRVLETYEPKFRYLRHKAQIGFVFYPVAVLIKIYEKLANK